MKEYKEKKKKPLWRRFLKWIFSTILSIALLLGGFCLYLYFRYQINVIEVIGQVRVLNQQVDVDRIATNKFSEEDLTSAKNKIENISTAENAVQFSDKELAAYFDDTIKNQESGLPMTFGSSTINLVDYGFAIVQMEFSNIPNDSSSEKLTDFNIVLKIELQKFKQEQMTGFFKGLVAKIMPNSLYFSCNLEITKTEDGGYETTSKFMTINNLAPEQTTSIFKTFNTFLGVGTSDAFNKSISDGFVQTMIGNGGLYDQLKTQNVATGYSFYNDGTNNNLIIYTADLEENRSITYHDGEGETIEYYTITDNIFPPKNTQKDGYVFDGWYDGEGEGANKVTSINAILLQDIELYARWTLLNYSISYKLNGGTLNGTNPTTYNVESENFTLINPEKQNYKFIGWTWEGQTTPIENVTIEKGSMTGNKRFVANFEANSYDITYKNQNNEEAEITMPVNYPTKHVYNQETILPTPTREGYTFNGWFLDSACESEPIDKIAASVNEENTVYAKWTINEYTLTLKDGSTVLFETTQNYGSEIPNQDDPVKTGYRFIGWSETIPTTMPGENKTILANFEAEQYNLTFKTNGGDVVEGRKITYNHTYGELPTPTKIGYEFEGWFTDDTWTSEVKSSTVCRTTIDIEIVAKWEIITYTITYVLNGGVVAGINPETYNVDTETFTLINPTRENLDFLGWIGTGLNGRSLEVTITKGSTENREYTAVFNDTRTLTIIVDSSPIQVNEFNYGEMVSTTNLFNAEELGMSGYSVEKWYSNPEMTEEFDTEQERYDNVNIYGSWTYLTDEIYFYPYLSTFEALENEDVFECKTQKDLIAFIDYVRFYNATKQIRLKLTYLANDGPTICSEINEIFNDLSSNPGFNTISEYQVGYMQINSQCYGVFYTANDKSSYEASLVMDLNKSYVCVQQDYAFKTTSSASTRNFNIDKVSKTLPVSNSDQLVWALENGYKPTINALNNNNTSHSAQNIYNKAKTVLSQICTDEMDNLTKVQRIYEWLVLHVDYDNFGAQQSQLMNANEVRKYDSWYADGVFNHGVAVCEGIAKAFVIMARIENIPAVMVVDDEHAWDKVYLNGNWYGIDPTHGSLVNTSNNKEFLTYASFLFTDEYKTANNHTAKNYTGFVANTVYNYFANASYTFNEQDFDLQINSAEELTLLLQYAKSVSANMNDTTYYTVEFAVSNDDLASYSNNNWLQIARSASGANYVGNLNSVYDTASNTIYRLLLTKTA